MSIETVEAGKALTRKSVNFTTIYMYSKLFARITESSLMEEVIPVRYTFVMLMAIADPFGLVVGTDIAISRRLNMPTADFCKCVKALGMPDENSNSKEEEGRRVVPSEDERGYRIVNYVTYRDLKDEDSRREYMRNYMRQRREHERLEGGVNNCKQVLKNVSSETQRQRQTQKHLKTHIQTPLKRGRGTAPSVEEVKLVASKIGVSEHEAEKFHAHYSSLDWMIGDQPVRNWQALLGKWKLTVKKPTKPESKQLQENIDVPSL